MKPKNVEIKINDFNLFFDVVKATSKLVESAKFNVNENGMSVFGTRLNVARCDIMSNAISSIEPSTFSIQNMNMLVKILTTVKDIHKSDIDTVKFFTDGNCIRIESKRFKNKLICCDDRVIERWIAEKVTTQMEPVFEFVTSTDFIKRLNTHTYIYPNLDELKVYLNTRSDMISNVIFATLGNKESNLNNEMVLEFGNVSFGKIKDDIVLNLERVNLFNIIPSSEIKISLMNIPVLNYSINLSGNNDTSAKIDIYCTPLKQ